MTKKKVLILGGGAAGINAALYEAAAGNSVYLAEPSPGIGGERIPQTRIITDGESFAGPDLTSVKNNKNIEILKSAEVQGLTRENRHYRVNLRCGTTRVDPEKCNECGECIKVCPIHMYDDYNAGLEWRTAIDSFGSASGDYNIFREDMPVCQRNCPINLDIRTYVGHIADRHYDKALATIRKKLPFALSIGRVCPHPCEDMCNRGDKDEPVSICALKRFAADHGVKNNIVPKLQLPAENYPEKIAIVGGGPSGLTCAYHLALLGYENV
ncbi:MAG: 4Fe-4S binding protein, partial [Deltaproteobacteria bacterium]|nr:4Fe-4S binding protein [Deltaproteobacteria bacterium]